MRRRPKGCPGCGHGRSRHVGFQCYGPLQLIPHFDFMGRAMLLQMVGGCSCNWAYWDNRVFRGWKSPEGVTSRRAGHYRRKIPAGII